MFGVCAVVDGAFGEVLTTCEKIAWTIKYGEQALKTEKRPTGTTAAAFVRLRGVLPSSINHTHTHTNAHTCLNDTGTGARVCRDADDAQDCPPRVCASW